MRLLSPEEKEAYLQRDVGYQKVQAQIAEIDRRDDILLEPYGFDDATKALVKHRALLLASSKMPRPIGELARNSDTWLSKTPLLGGLNSVCIMALTVLIARRLERGEDFHHARELVSNRLLLEAAGFNDAQVAEVRAFAGRGDLEGAFGAVRQAYSSIDFRSAEVLAQRERAGKEFLADQENRAASVQMLEAKGVLPPLANTAEGWRVRYRDGSNRVYQSKAQADAARWQWARDREIAVSQKFREAVEQVESTAEVDSEFILRLRNEEMTDGQFRRENPHLNDQVDVRIQQGKALAPGGQTEATAGPQQIHGEEAQAFEESTSMSTATASSTEAQEAAIAILGTSVSEYLEGMHTTTMTFYKGHTAFTAMEEMVEGKAKKLLALPGKREWMRRALREVEERTGQQIFRTQDDAQLDDSDMVEAWSHLSLSLYVGRSGRGEELAHGFDEKGYRRTMIELLGTEAGPALRSQRTLLEGVYRRAAALNGLKKQGVLDAELESTLAWQLGLEGRRKGEGAVEEGGAWEQTEAVEDGAGAGAMEGEVTFSLGPSANELREAMPHRELPSQTLSQPTAQEAFAWWENNMVGRTLNLPVGLSFTANPGHFFRFVAHKTGGARKGFVEGYGDKPSAVQADLREGKISAAQIAGWETFRAEHLPILPDLLTDPDFVLAEIDDFGRVSVHLVKRYKGNFTTVGFVAAGGKFAPLSFSPVRMKPQDIAGMHLLYAGPEIKGGVQNSLPALPPVTADNWQAQDPAAWAKKYPTLELKVKEELGGPDSTSLSLVVPGDLEERAGDAGASGGESAEATQIFLDGGSGKEAQAGRADRTEGSEAVGDSVPTGYVATNESTDVPEVSFSIEPAAVGRWVNKQQAVEPPVVRLPHGGETQLINFAKGLWAKLPSTVQSRDGRTVTLKHNAQGTEEVLFEHLTTSHDKTGRTWVDRGRVKSIFRITSTIENARPRFIAENGNHIYIQRYADGFNHYVVTKPDGLVVEHGLSDTLQTQWLRDAAGDAYLPAKKLDFGSPSSVRSDQGGAAGTTTTSPSQSNIAPGMPGEAGPVREDGGEGDKSQAVPSLPQIDSATGTSSTSYSIVPHDDQSHLDEKGRSPDSKADEHLITDPRTRQRSLVSGPYFDERARPALRDHNRRRLGQAQSLYREPEPAGTAEAKEGEESIEFAARRLGIPIVRLPDIGIVTDRYGVFRPADERRLKKLPAGSEAQPFLDKDQGVVYKVFAADEELGTGKKLAPRISDAGQWEVGNSPASDLEALEKLALISERGGLSTEIVGVTTRGYWVVKQPEARHVDESEFEKARKEAVVAFGAVPLNSPGLEHVWVFLHQGKPWLLGDLHRQNIMKDSTGKARVMDALVCPMPEQMLIGLPGANEAVKRAEALGKK